MAILATPLLTLIPSTVMAFGALLGIAVLSMLIGNVIGRFTGMLADYFTRPDEIHKPIL